MIHHLICCSKYNCNSVTRNYFENLVRALENGLSDVSSIGASSKTTSSKFVAGSSKAKSGRGKGSSRTGGSSKGTEDSGSWACDHCTYLNVSRSATVCQMCSQRRWLVQYDTSGLKISLQQKFQWSKREGYKKVCLMVRLACAKKNHSNLICGRCLFWERVNKEKQETGARLLYMMYLSFLCITSIFSFVI